MQAGGAGPSLETESTDTRVTASRLLSTFSEGLEECILSFAICIFLKIHPTRILFRTRKHSKQSTEKRSTKWWFRRIFPLAIFLSRMQTCNHDHQTLDSDVPHQSIALLLLMMRTAIGPSSGCNDLAPISRIKPDDVINQRFRKLYIEFYRSYHKFSRNDLLSTLKILISDLISLFPKPLHEVLIPSD